MEKETKQSEHRNDETSETKAHPVSTGSLPDQGAGRDRRELVGLVRGDDAHGRQRGRWPAGHHPDWYRRPGRFAEPAAPALWAGAAVDFGPVC